MKRISKWIGKVLLCSVALAGLAVTVNNAQAVPRESCSWNYVDDNGDVVGDGWIDCSGHRHTEGTVTTHEVSTGCDPC